ncbi:MAG: DUF4230 domain-containing protein [Anaerolineae bacterium]|nr:DUF4230 domain-containing protein [Anaerolineae bacterium]
MNEQLPPRAPDNDLEIESPPRVVEGQTTPPDQRAPIIVQSRSPGCTGLIWRIILALLVTVGCLLTVVVVAGLLGVGAIGNLFNNLLGGPPVPIIHPTVTVLTLVQREAVLETARYNFEKVVPVEFAQHMGGISGERLLYIGVGYVEAGVDLTGLTEDNITVDGEQNVTIALPPAHLTSCVLNAQKSYIYQHDTGVINFLYQILYQEPDLLELAEAYAIIAFRESALESGILELAQEDAEHQLRSILLAAGMRSVTFVPQVGVEPQHDETCIIPTPTPTP